MVVFCEDCGKRQIVVRDEGDRGAALQFRCAACGYRNTMPGKQGRVANRDCGGRGPAPAQDRTKDKPIDSEKH